MSINPEILRANTGDSKTGFLSINVTAERAGRVPSQNKNKVRADAKGFFVAAPAIKNV